MYICIIDASNSTKRATLGSLLYNVYYKVR